MKFFLPIILFFSCTFLTAQNNSVLAQAFLDSTNFFVGDKITIHTKVEIPAGVNSISNPKPKINFDTTAFELQTYSDWKENGVRRQLDITLLAWDTGVFKLSLEPFIIEGQSFVTDTLTVTVHNPHDLDAMKEPQPIKDIIREEKRWEDYLPFLIPFVTALVIGFIFWRLWKYYKNKDIQRASAPIIKKTERTPKELALQQLQDLKKKKYPEADNTKQYYTELSDIVRTYIENQYKIPALENTTDEIFRKLNRKAVLTNTSKNLRDALSIADLAKFAQVTPTLIACEQHWQYVFDFIKQYE